MEEDQCPDKCCNFGINIHLFQAPTSTLPDNVLIIHAMACLLAEINIEKTVPGRDQ